MVVKRYLTGLLLVLTLLLVGADNPPPLTASPEIQAELSAAFFQRLDSKSESGILTFDLFTPELDTAFISLDGQHAVLWLALRDDYGRILASEPGLVLAKKTVESWEILLPGDPTWDMELASLPTGMLPLEKQPAPDGFEMEAVVAADALTGYYLPYVAGTSRWLEGSISHFQTIPELGYPSCTEEYCRYAFDFTDDNHFPLVAAKGGTVLSSRDSCADGTETCTNYIVLRNVSEGTYQIYLHLAHDTIPNQLTPGTTVQRGEYLGDTDDTGYSTSNHVHFMVTTSVWVGGDGYFWGRSVEVHFADVPINGGIPRTCYEVTSFTIYDGATDCIGNRSDPRNPANDWFLSGNIGAYPPTGSLTRPAAGAVVNTGTNPLIDVTASVSDDVRVASARFVVRLNGQWVEVGPRVTSQASPGVFDWDVDLCAVGPLNGPLEVALTLWDHEGTKVSALSPRTIQVDHACPPPVSQMTVPDTFDASTIRLKWTVSSLGIGLDGFDLQWRNEPGTWSNDNILHFDSTARWGWFAGNAGGTYAFRIRALDVNGQAEPWPAGDVAEIMTTFPAACTEDYSEPDDSFLLAKSLQVGDVAYRNLCPAGDADWFRLENMDSGYYQISSHSLNAGAAVRVTLLAGDGQTILATGSAPGLAQHTFLLFNLNSPASVYFKIEPLFSYLQGTSAGYDLSINAVNVMYLPWVAR